MFETLREQVFDRTLSELGARVSAFAPNVLAMCLILVSGVVLAGAVHLVVRVVLTRVGFDRFASRAGLSTVLQRGGILRSPANLTAVALAWTVLAGFVILAIGALNLQIAVDLLSRAFLYLPQVLIAIAIVILGTLVSAFLRRSVLIAAVNAGVPSARILAGGIQVAIMVLVAAMALEHLGIGRQIIVAAFTILFGGVVFAVSLAFGLGARGLARDWLLRMAPRNPAERSTDDALRHV